MDGITIHYNNAQEAKIVKDDKNKPWPNNQSDEALLKLLGRNEVMIRRVQYTDEKGIGDGLVIYFADIV